MSIDVDDDRGVATPKGPFADPAARPLDPTPATRARWGGLAPKELRRDSEYMRWMQSHRSAESLSEAGKLGYRAAVAALGYDGMQELAATERREHPERASEPEKACAALLGRLGQRAGRDYHREYKLAPGVYGDFAWPEQMKAVEVWGGVHDREDLRRLSPEAAESRVLRDSKRFQDAIDRGWTIKVVTDRALEGERAERTEREVAAFLEPGEAPTDVPGVWAPGPGRDDLKRTYEAETRLAEGLREADPALGGRAERDFRITDWHRVSLAWMDTKRAAMVYPDRAAAAADRGALDGARANGWRIMDLTRDGDLAPDREADTRDRVLAWARGTQSREGRDARARAEREERAALLERASESLAELAGPDASHIEMTRGGSAKYLDREGAITPELAQAHLRGARTLGASLHGPDGTTRCDLWDRDDEPGWELLRGAAEKLRESGAAPLLERSPGDRGGHLVLAYGDRVDAVRSRATAERHAPELREVAEHWPRAEGGRTHVRLPGGLYRRGETPAWVPLSADGREWRTGPEAWRLIAETRTPAAWVTEPSPAAEESAREPERRGETPPPDSRPADPRADRPLPEAAHDATWLRENGHRAEELRYWATTERVVRHFNETHRVEDMLDVGPNGYALASWRGERTPSVRPVGENRWVDYGAGGQRPDGRRDGGDALELHCRLEALTKREAMAAAARELAADCDREVESAAREGRVPEARVAALMSPAGWREYDRLLAEADRERTAAREIPPERQIANLEGALSRYERADATEATRETREQLGEYRALHARGELPPTAADADADPL